MWATLKGNKRVAGCKRAASESSSGSSDTKRSKISLDMSSTCDRLDKFNLCSTASSEGASAFSALDIDDDFSVPRERGELISESSFDLSEAENE